MQRALLIALSLTASACSQRSPWVTVPPPATVPQPARPAQPRQEGTPLSIPMSTAAPADANDLAGITLHFPVADFDGRPFADSYSDSRDGGARRHHAIDIVAPRGTPVLSVQDGRILRLSRNAKGGISIYATDTEERFVFYYAHLDRYHARIREGMPLSRGDTIGYVGATGNAPEHVPHLHFQMMRMPGDRRYWNGEPVNPYHLLRAAISPAAGR